MGSGAMSKRPTVEVEGGLYYLGGKPVSRLRSYDSLANDDHAGGLSPA